MNSPEENEALVKECEICQEPTLAGLRVCYDHAQLCPMCKEEPANPNSFCSKCYDNNKACRKRTEPTSQDYKHE